MLAAQAVENRPLFVQLFRQDVDLGLVICVECSFVEFLGVGEVILLAIEICIRFEDLPAEETKIVELTQLESPVEMFLGLLEFAPVEVQACNVQMADRFLRELLVGLVLAKDPLELSKRFAEVAAESRCEREIVRHHPDVRFIRQFFSELESDTKLLFGLSPASLHDQTQTTRIRALQKRLRMLRNERLGSFE